MSRSMKYSAYETPVSLWKIVELYVPDSEQPELKNLLGESLVDQSLELHEEVNVLLEIWRDMQTERARIKSPRLLPEPPGVRDRLVQQIIFYVESIKEKVSKDGRNPAEVFSSCKTEVIDYACDSARGSSSSSLSRPSTARSSKDGRETPWRHTPNSDRAISVTSEDLECMNKKLNILDFDEVSKQLTDYLQHEVERLLEDIPFLQECLEKATNSESEDEDTPEPTLIDLREERTKLERQLLSESPPPVPTMPDVGRTKCSNNLKTVPRVSAAGDRVLPRRGPVKASHAVNVRVVELPDAVNPRISLPPGKETNNNLLVKGPMTSSTGPTNQRPSSATRFRKMVLNSRSDT